MDYDMATIFAISVIALTAGKLFWLLGRQIMGDISEIGQLAKLRAYRNKRAYRPRVSVVVISGISQQDISARLGNVFNSSYTDFDVIVAAPANSPAYNQARYYRQKHRLGKRLRIVKVSGGKTPFATVLRAVSGNITLILDDGISLLPNTIAHGILPFRDRKLKLVAPAAYPQLDNRLASAIQGFASLFVQHLGRIQRHKVPTSAPALFIRTAALRKTADAAALSAQAIADVSAKMPPREKLRTPQSAVHVSLTPGSYRVFRAQPLFGALIALIDVLAVVLLFQLLDARQATFMVQLAVLFVFILAAIAVISAKPLGIVSKLNLVLSAPFAYIAYLANAVASIGYYTVAHILRIRTK